MAGFITILTVDSSGVDVKAGELTLEYIGRMFERIGISNWRSKKLSLGVVDTISLQCPRDVGPITLDCSTATVAIQRFRWLRC